MKNQAIAPGVFIAYKKNGEVYYRASLTYKRKHISLGSYDTEEAAHRAYLQGSILIHNDSTTLMHYTENSILPFEKWVVIINFRDNDIYFGNPIYVSQKLFYYYLSPTHILKFDIDDLFYFSSHKIMCRGNHYFVADYGMQVNIASRFDIKNYAVLDVDYRFLNGDTTDFRRENIEIINKYHGVRPKLQKGQKNGAQKYCARIHIHGNYLIGTYDTPLEAAIAYNKAIDLLSKNGLQKEFVPNYIEGLSPSKYAEIYTNVAISEKILNYTPTSQHNQ